MTFSNSFAFDHVGITIVIINRLLRFYSEFGSWWATVLDGLVGDVLNGRFLVAEMKKWSQNRVV